MAILSRLRVVLIVGALGGCSTTTGGSGGGGNGQGLPATLETAKVATIEPIVANLHRVISVAAPALSRCTLSATAAVNATARTISAMAGNESAVHFYEPPASWGTQFAMTCET